MLCLLTVVCAASGPASRGSVRSQDVFSDDDEDGMAAASGTETFSSHTDDAADLFDLRAFEELVSSSLPMPSAPGMSTLHTYACQYDRAEGTHCESAAVTLGLVLDAVVIVL